MNDWNALYKSGKQMSIFPFSDLVSFVYRYTAPFEGMKVLDLGCGAGANIPLFKHLGADYHAIEQSEVIVESLIKRYPELKGKIVIGDFTKPFVYPYQFDLVVDRSSVTHNTTADIKSCLAWVYDSMKIGAEYIGIDWFSEGHNGYYDHTEVLDEHTFGGFKVGVFKGLGKVHFSTEEHIRELFKDFQIEEIEHKIVEKVDGKRYSTYNFLAEKQA